VVLGGLLRAAAASSKLNLNSLGFTDPVARDARTPA
jgi:hypothetical protein